MQTPSSAQCSQDVYSLRCSRSQQCRTHIAMPILQSPGGLWSFEACNCSSKFQIKLIKLMKFVPNFSKGNTPPALKVLTGPGGCIWSGDRRPCGALRRFRCCSRTVASWSRCWTSSVTWMQVKRLTETDSFLSRIFWRFSSVRYISGAVQVSGSSPSNPKSAKSDSKLGI